MAFETADEVIPAQPDPVPVFDEATATSSETSLVAARETARNTDRIPPGPPGPP